ncbi:MAG: YncE family protein [Runella sp.]
MKYLQKKSWQILAVGFIATLAACNREVEPTQPYDEGVVVINAGNFLDNNGSLSFLKRENKVADLDIFLKENNRPITGGISGYAEVDQKGLILVDNSTAGQDKVEIVNARTMKSIATLAAPDIENPRAVVGVGPNKAYVSCWGTTGTFPNFYANPGFIAVVDLNTNKVTKRIPLQKGAEGIVVVGTEAFVGGVGGDRLVQVIDIQRDEVKTSINVEGNAGVLRVDANNKIWTFVGREAVRINPMSKTVEAKIRVGSSTTKSPSLMTMSADGKAIFFAYTFYDAADGFKQKGEIYRFNITDTAISDAQPLIRRVFTGLGYDPKNNVLYAGNTPSFKQSGFVMRYQPSGQLIDSVKVEIAPSGFYFK